jgi:hypothetical protein
MPLTGVGWAVPSAEMNVSIWVVPARIMKLRCAVEEPNLLVRVCATPTESSEPNQSMVKSPGMCSPAASGAAR